MSENIETKSISAEEKTDLIKSLLHKEGCWVDWGKICQKLRQAGVNPQEIFEETGLQNSQQNLVIVASQVFNNLEQLQAEEDLLNYYRGPRSDVLYELRILNQEERLKGAKLIKNKQLDVDGAKEVAKAIKHFSHLAQPPAGFTVTAGDAVAYQYWKLAKQKKTLAQKARLIAEGLKFAESATAREKIEQLLTESAETESSKQNVSAPLLPLYRIQSEYESPLILPVVGSLPLPVTSLNNIPSFDRQSPFGAVELKQHTKLAAIPSWQVILQAEKPVIIFCQSDDLPTKLTDKSESLLVVVDLENKEWDANSYYLINSENNCQFGWFANQPEEKILGKLLVILRPQKIFDEDNLTQPWQMDD